MDTGLPGNPQISQTIFFSCFDQVNDLKSKPVFIVFCPEIVRLLNESGLISNTEINGQLKSKF